MHCLLVAYDNCFSSFQISYRVSLHVQNKVYKVYGDPTDIRITRFELIQKSLQLPIYVYKFMLGLSLSC